MKKQLAALLMVVALSVTVLPIYNVEAAVTLKNPQIVEDDTMYESGQKVTYDCVWFGEYPQSEVVMAGSTAEDALKEMNEDSQVKYEVINADEFNAIKNADYDSNGDAEVNGEKYRRLKGEDATYHASSSTAQEWGYYDWKDDFTTYHYFKYEPIKWRVLNVDGQEALLLSDVILNDLYYNSESDAVVWANSTMRSWLNGYGSSDNQSGIDYSNNNFLRSAFSDSEQAAIPTKLITDHDNVYDEGEGVTDGGPDTRDKIFLLSVGEVDGIGNSTYGFSDHKARECKTSTYASAMGTYYDTYIWFLRSPGIDGPEWVAVIDSGGSLSYVGLGVHYVGNGVRPALYLNLSNTDSYSYAGTVCTDGTEKEENVLVDKPETPSTPSTKPEQNNTSEKETPAGQISSPVTSVKTSSVCLSGIFNKIAAGKKVQLTVTFTPSNVSNKTVIWTSSNPKVATVNQNGVVKFKKKSAGKTVIITATAADGSGAKAVFRLKSMKGVVKKVAISGAKKRTVKVGKALKLKAKVTATKGANKKLQWTSSNTKYATVSASGKVKTKKAGKGKTVKITAMATDGSGKNQVVKVRIK